MCLFRESMLAQPDFLGASNNKLLDQRQHLWCCAIDWIRLSCLLLDVVFFNLGLRYFARSIQRWIESVVVTLTVENCNDVSKISTGCRLPKLSDYTGVSTLKMIHACNVHNGTWPRQLCHCEHCRHESFYCDKSLGHRNLYFMSTVHKYWIGPMQLFGLIESSPEYRTLRSEFSAIQIQGWSWKLWPCCS